MVFGIAGPSGAGKSYLSVLSEALMRELDPSVRVVPISIDAYHYPNEYLASRPSERGTLKDVKGRYDTYDVSALLYDLSEFRKGEKSVRFPVYSRKLHEPIPGAIKVDDGPTLLLVEGLWLLFEKGGWGEIRPLFDRIVYPDDDPSKLRERTVMRHERGGRAPDDAARHYDESDAVNRILVEATKARADETLV
jgi:pantothenate kinase